MKYNQLLFSALMSICATSMTFSQIQENEIKSPFVEHNAIENQGLVLPNNSSQTNSGNPSTQNDEIVVLDFEGLGNLDSINDFYNGGTSSQGFSGTDFNISFNTGALALIDTDAGGAGNFANEPSPSTIMIFLDDEPVLDALDGFETGFSFFYSAIDITGSVTVFDGPNATGNVIGFASFEGLGQDPEDIGGDPQGENNRWASVSVPIDGVGFSILFSGLADAIGFDNITFGSVTPGVTCPPEDVVLRSQEDIDEFAATYPDCTNIPVGIFITEDMATSGDVMDFSPLSFIETIDGHLVFWRVASVSDFSGFESLTSVGDVLGLNAMRNVSSLNGLQNVESVGWLQVASMKGLSSLEELESLEEIQQRLVISSNRNLSECSIEAVCDLLDDGKPARVFNNASGCNSASDIEAACDSNGRTTNVTEVKLSPNPVGSTIRINEIRLTSESPLITILDQNGILVETIEEFKDNGTILTFDINSLKSGIYFLHIIDEDQIYTSTFFKQ